MDINEAGGVGTDQDLDRDFEDRRLDEVLDEQEPNEPGPQPDKTAEEVARAERDKRERLNEEMGLVGQLDVGNGRVPSPERMMRLRRAELRILEVSHPKRVEIADYREAVLDSEDLEIVQLAVKDGLTVQAWTTHVIGEDDIFIGIRPFDTKLRATGLIPEPLERLVETGVEFYLLPIEPGNAGMVLSRAKKRAQAVLERKLGLESKNAMAQLAMLDATAAERVNDYLSGIGDRPKVSLFL